MLDKGEVEQTLSAYRILSSWFGTGVPYDRFVASSSGWLTLLAGAVSNPYVDNDVKTVPILFGASL